MATPDQYAHLDRLNRKFTSKNTIKYIEGTNEHPGNLWDLTPLELAHHALEEAIDQVNFLITLIDLLELEDNDE